MAGTVVAGHEESIRRMKGEGRPQVARQEADVVRFDPSRPSINQWCRILAVICCQRLAGYLIVVDSYFSGYFTRPRFKCVQVRKFKGFGRGGNRTLGGSSLQPASRPVATPISESSDNAKAESELFLFASALLQFRLYVVV